MKTIIGVLFLLLMQLQLHSQNLVPNWSFEDTLTCPNSAGQISYAPPWFSPTSGTSDYCNECASGGTAIPNNFWGYQYARTGKGYAGFGTYCVTCPPPSPNEREYISVKLNDSLIAGKKYCVEFYVSIGELGGIACDAIGAYFSNDLISSPITTYLPYTPQINNNQGIISDTINWTLISGEFIAVGGEEYITIGNFQTDANTNIDTIGTPLGSYYYIDDVSVQLCDTTIPSTNSFYIPNAFSPNGDNNNDVLFVRGKNIDQLSFAVYSRWGEKVFETNDIAVGWDGTFRGENLETAVFAYYLTLTYFDGTTVVKKGNISLIR